MEDRINGSRVDLFQTYGLQEHNQRIYRMQLLERKPVFQSKEDIQQPLYRLIGRFHPEIPLIRPRQNR